MGRLLTDLSEYTELNEAQAEPGEPVDLNLAVRKTLEDLKFAIDEADAKITAEMLPTIRGRETSFIQLFQNLIENSIKYRNTRPPEVHISAEMTGTEWRIAVSDNGIGIEPRYYEHVFAAFKRLHGREIPGTGIGLAICRRIVERYGGRIWLESEIDRGSTFYFTLPLLEQELVAANSN